MAGELTTDERVQDAEQRMKVEVFKAATDSLSTQLKERFQTEDLNMLTAMSFFSPTALLSEKQVVTEKDIRVLCAFYGIDAQTVVTALAEFRHIYRQLQDCVHMDDLLHVNSAGRPTTGNVKRQAG